MLEIFGTEINLQPIWLTLEVATMTTIVLLVLGTPLAWWMAQMRSSNKVFLEALVALPLVLPPTVLGFYLLILFNPNGTVTEVLHWFGFEGQLTFSKTGLVIGSVFYSLPFAIQPLMHAFENIPHRLLDAAATMRASFLDRFWTIVLPLSRRGILVAATLSFAHTVGEFGVVLMVGGNIPGETRMVSIDIFDHVESLEYDQAHILSAMMLIFALSVLMLVYGLNRRFGVKVG
ncbi:molybdate ABC transporter permease subunit [Thiomicrospira sp. S5]|uniref:molybdate ABC transporter permease subunit n=1 Tax=Thiomicrospira sp. S5 TaxID=1803865 RepID=UPI000F8A102B|nr:molybdate ABC transporter permease subunit [Thiomicrospira sp. S5]AZR81260.1 molybdenum ABC transporter permease [Thiomicrospira sp. S5]AZR81429.1 molybdenum ABC transporter permease [Thiomicrospira sp. S5]